MYIPTHKTTGQVYPAVTEQEREAMEAYYHTKGKYNFAEVPGTEPAPVPEKPKPSTKNTPAEPIEAKRADNA